MPDGWQKADRPWEEYPIGTKARQSWEGGWWIKTEMGWKWHNGSTFPRPGGADQVMLEAAPTPPASIAWPRECEGLCKAAEQFKEAVGELWKAENPDELQDGETAMSEEGARELHSERWKALDSAIYYMRKRMSAPPAQEPDLSQEARDWYAKRRSATPPAQDDEPVAWLYKSGHGACANVRKMTPIEGETEMPLYTRPDTSGLRKAAEEVVASIRTEADNVTFTNALEHLRAALEGK